MYKTFFKVAKSLLPIVCIFIISVLLSARVYANSDESKPPVRYQRDQIRNTRFGDEERQQLLQKIYKIDEELNKIIFGQELAAQALKSRLAQYIDGYGSRTKEPIALNLVGLPGIGKSAMIGHLDTLGIQTLHFDAQAFTASSINTDFISMLHHAINQLDDKKPILLIIEELDKVAEISGATERTEKLIGSLNEILSEGKLSVGHGRRLELSNVMVLTTMNLSPLEITTFSKEALGEEKSFYDFTIENFAKFHLWITNQASALPKVLSRLFRSNTVSRLSPNTVLLKPLSFKDYRKVTHKTMNQVIKRMTSGQNEHNRLEVSYTDELLDFITEKSTYAPSGSRNTVAKSDALTEQLVHFAKRVTTEGDESLNRPRKVRLSFDKNSQRAIIEITPQALKDNKTLVDGKSFSVFVEFSTEGIAFIPPSDIALKAPSLVNKNSGLEKPLTKTQIRDNRFPKNLNLAKDLNKKLNEQIFGQEQFTKIITQEMNNYLARPDAAEKNPSGIILAGFPGIGKSELINLTGKYLDLPIVRINLQQYSSSDSNASNSFVSTIQNQIRNLNGKKYILLLEELDKIYEVDPKTGLLINRPVMALIKDLLNDGRINYTHAEGGNTNHVAIDVRNAFVAVTMNFAVDRFRFEADPRLTTIEDVVGAWKRLSTRLTDLKTLMGTMFLPETVNRLLARIYIMNPLEKVDYETLIEKQINDVIKSRFYDKKGRDIGQVELQITQNYRQYLYSESVIPSEGARHTLNTVKGFLNDDIDLLTKKIPKNSKFSGERLIYILDYVPESQKVIGSITVKANPEIAVKDIYQRTISLAFPPLNAIGKMSKNRIVTGIHEFGHAFVSLRLGKRFEYATVVPPRTGVGGYVKYSDGDRSAMDLVNSIYSSVASRAMERIILSDQARSDYSVLSITSGASSDIQQATMELFNAIHQFGFDPKGGTIERTGESPFPYANFSKIPAEEVEKLGRILRAMEDSLVDDLLKAHSQEWYLSKITEFTRVGGVFEKEFYQLVEYAYPGDAKKSPSEKSRLHELFKNDIINEDSRLLRAKSARNSRDNKTVPERAADFKKLFADTVKYHLHAEERAITGGSCAALFAQ